MAVRLGPIAANGARFDEALPLYAWYEDLDFSRRAAGPLGVQQVCGAQGVHLGVKLGRTPGLRLGYSQIANPVYLLRRRVLTWRYALDSILRHVSVNLIRSLRPECYVDRRGRLRGNLLAMGDMLRDRLRPDRILDL